MSKTEENKRRDFLEEVLMLAKFYNLTREDVLEIFGIELLNTEKQ